MAKVTKIYRVEHRHDVRDVNDIGVSVHEGCYREQYENKEMCDAHIDNDHPLISVDVEEFIHMFNPFCACPTMSKLKKWFDGYLEYLRDKDFILTQYEVTNFYVGKSGLQGAFELGDVIGKKVLPWTKVIK
jgi:hypothetical protein